MKPSITTTPPKPPNNIFFCFKYCSFCKAINRLNEIKIYKYENSILKKLRKRISSMSEIAKIKKYLKKKVLYCFNGGKIQIIADKYVKAIAEKFIFYRQSGGHGLENSSV